MASEEINIESDSSDSLSFVAIDDVELEENIPQIVEKTFAQTVYSPNFGQGSSKTSKRKGDKYHILILFLYFSLMSFDYFPPSCQKEIQFVFCLLFEPFITVLICFGSSPKTFIYFFFLTRKTLRYIEIYTF